MGFFFLVVAEVRGDVRGLRLVLGVEFVVLVDLLQKNLLLLLIPILVQRGRIDLRVFGRPSVHKSLTWVIL